MTSLSKVRFDEETLDVEWYKLCLFFSNKNPNERFKIQNEILNLVKKCSGEIWYNYDQHHFDIAFNNLDDFVFIKLSYKPRKGHTFILNEGKDLSLTQQLIKKWGI